MLHAARALVVVEDPHASEQPADIVREFRTRFCDTQIFYDRFAGAQFANYLFAAHERQEQAQTEESSKYRIAEAQLFIDAAHACSNKLSQQPVAV
jgi:sulfite reductase (ferredoxin)